MLSFQALSVVPAGQVATVGQQDEQLFNALAKMAERRLDQFNAQELANTAWAFATVGQQDEQLFKVLAKIAKQRLNQFNAQGLANMAWALAVATASLADVQLFDALTWAAEWYIGDSSEQGICMAF